MYAQFCRNQVLPHSLISAQLLRTNDFQPLKDKIINFINRKREVLSNVVEFRFVQIRKYLLVLFHKIKQRFAVVMNRKL